MNERFNELRLDAGIAGLHNEPYLVVINKSGEIIDPIIGLEKFAELIVRECASIYDKIDNGNPHLGTENYLEALHKHFQDSKPVLKYGSGVNYRPTLPTEE